MKLPLEGIKVVEFSHMVMGPSCGMILGDLGAEVIKVEPRGKGDKTRYLPGSGSGLFPAYNRNKKSFQADLENETDRGSVRELLQSADVLIENFRTGKLAQYGFDYETLKKINPRLVYCSLKGFQPGPYGDRAALDEVVQMLGGLAYMTGPPGQPLRAGASVNDIMGGMFGVIGILSALRLRDHTGEGCEVMSSLFENNVFLVGSHMAQAGINGIQVKPMPAREATWAVYDLFRSGDDEMIFIAAVSDTQWGILCETFGLTELLADGELATNRGRVLRREHIHQVLQAALGNLSTSSIESMCEKAGLPYAKVNTPGDLENDPHLLETGSLLKTALPDGKEILIPALPLSINGERLPKLRDIPAPGEHNEEITSILHREQIQLQ